MTHVKSAPTRLPRQLRQCFGGARHRIRDRPDGARARCSVTGHSRDECQQEWARASYRDSSAREFDGASIGAATGGYGGLTMVGTADQIADEMQAWFEAEACDGFNVMFPYLPEGLDAFVDQVVPALQRRDLHRKAYQGNTLREHLGLSRPPNQFFHPEHRASQSISSILNRGPTYV